MMGIHDRDDGLIPERCRHCESMHAPIELCKDVKEKEERYRIARMHDLMKYQECKTVDAQNKKIIEFRMSMLNNPGSWSKKK